MLVGRTIHCEIHKLINSIWNKVTCLNSARSHILYLFKRRVVKLTVVIKQVHHFCFINETNSVHDLSLVYFVDFIYNLCMFRTRRNNCLCATLGACYSVQATVWYAGRIHSILHTRQSAIQNNKYKVSHKHICSS